ncbi:MAG: hypothetical protein ACK56I_28065, partial [bacterium]
MQLLDDRLAPRVVVGEKIEIGHPHDFVQVRAAEQRALHDLYLLLDVRPHGDAVQQRGQKRVGVDVDPGLGLEPVGDQRQREP